MARKSLKDITTKQLEEALSKAISDLLDGTTTKVKISELSFDDTIYKEVATDEVHSNGEFSVVLSYPNGAL